MTSCFSIAEDNVGVVNSGQVINAVFLHILLYSYLVAFGRLGVCEPTWAFLRKGRRKILQQVNVQRSAAETDLICEAFRTSTCLKTRLSFLAEVTGMSTLQT